MPYIFSILLLVAGTAWSGGSRLECANPTYDFGMVGSTAVVTHAFQLANTGDAPLKINRTRTCCGATADLASNALAPGTSTTLRVTLAVDGKQGRVEKAVAAELGDPSRFAGADMAKKVLAYAGCEPRVRESGKWKGRTKMSKRGSPALRNALYLMAGTIRLHTPCFNALYKRQVAMGKHHNVALSHVVRKIVDVMCGMYKTNTLFVPPQTDPTPC